MLRALSRNKEATLKDIMGHFDINDDEGNDAIIKEAIHGLFPRILNSVNHPNTGTLQSCTSRK